MGEIDRYYRKISIYLSYRRNDGLVLKIEMTAGIHYNKQSLKKRENLTLRLLSILNIL